MASSETETDKQAVGADATMADAATTGESPKPRWEVEDSLTVQAGTITPEETSAADAVALAEEAAQRERLGILPVVVNPHIQTIIDECRARRAVARVLVVDVAGKLAPYSDELQRLTAGGFALVEIDDPKQAEPLFTGDNFERGSWFAGALCVDPATGAAETRDRVLAWLAFQIDVTGYMSGLLA